MKNKEKECSVLMVAYHYPPVGHSSGVHRTLKFSQYLPAYGWRPTILTIHPRAFERVSDHQLGDIPPDVHVERAFGLDTAKHLTIMRRYPGFLALPDRWVSWLPGAIISGLKLIRKRRLRVIFSTYPIATAHLIGLTLHKLTGLPWVADFRDSMTEDDYPSGRAKWKIYRWIEQKVVENAERVIFTTPGTIKMYTQRYPNIPKERWAVIENGYDEDNFHEAEHALVVQPASGEKPTTLVHSGLLYPQERDPRDFFAAVQELKQEGKIDRNTLHIVLRASGNESQYQNILNKLRIDDIVELAPPVSYGEALCEMLKMDGLLIFQASNCNHQIPAKIYEYLRARKPIFALTDSIGDTAGVLRKAGINTIVALDNKIKIKSGLMTFLEMINNQQAPIASDEVIARYSRKSRTKELSKLLDLVVGK